MSWPGDMKLLPETAAETEAAATPQGMRRRLREYSRHNALTRAVWHMAQAEGLSGEDEMTVLAYHALIRLEAMTEERLRIANCTPLVGLVPAEITSGEKNL